MPTTNGIIEIASKSSMVYVSAKCCQSLEPIARIFIGKVEKRNTSENQIAWKTQRSRSPTDYKRNVVDCLNSHSLRKVSLA